MLDALWFDNDWTLVEDLLCGRGHHTGALFTTSNGRIGLRGRRDEPFGQDADGDVLAIGCYETRPYAHPETSYGIPEHYQTIVGVTDPWVLAITIDHTPMTLSSGTWLARTRRLDLRTGCVTTTGTWRAPTGATVEVETRRMASLASPHLLWTELSLTAVDTAVAVDLTIETRANTGIRTFPGEPDAISRAWGRIFRPQLVSDGRDGPVGLVHATTLSGRAVACATEVVGSVLPIELRAEADSIRRRFRAHAVPGEPLTWTQRAGLVTGSFDHPGPLLDDAAHVALAHSGEFEAALDDQRARFARFWDAADVEIGGDVELERAVRLSSFHLYQAAACGEGWSPAKGLTGQGYEGHHLWEHEIYIGQALDLTTPDAAREGLMFRCRTLPQARERARTLSLRGAQFPWRTIDGTEASAFFPAGAAQHHVNADIAWAIERYVASTGDTSLLRDGGLHVLVETARFWMSLGRFDDVGDFRIEGVTGPDEYTALVDNNLYTNLMAAANLRAAADRLDELAADDAAMFEAVVVDLGLGDDEPGAWRRAAEAVLVPYDDGLGVHGQDDSFLRLPRWNLDATPDDELPLQDHHHLLTLYRHQVLKQADVVLAQFLLPERFSPDQHRRNYDYYEPLTTHDSSLSAPIHAIVAASVGHLDQALEHVRECATIDLADHVGSLDDGLHLAAAAGTWLAMVCGFGGFRIVDGQASFRPQLPPSADRLHVRVRFRGALIDVDANAESCTYRLVEGDPCTVLHDGEPVELAPGASVRRDAVASPAVSSG